MFWKKSGRVAGNDGEQLACTYLEHQGLVTVERNFSTRQGEIDLIMREQNTLVFVEVRLRSRSDYGTGADSVTRRKQQRLIITANQFLQKRFGNNPPACRFDVVSIGGQNAEKIDWIKDAFQPAG
ncbi:MAG: YraN family protein [Chromatiales bacterium]|nr:YraN family protein [Chromatiales bacterium]